MQWKKILTGGFKMIAIIGSTAFIAHRLWYEWKSGFLAQGFQKINESWEFYLIATFILMIVNWGLETFKWSLLLRPIQPVNWKESAKSVLSGITVSIFTPNRIGEFAGRIFILNENNRVQGIMATMVGNLTQLLITLSVGLLLFPFFLHRFPYSLNLNSNWIFLFSIAQLIMGILILIKWNSIIRVVQQWFVFKKYPLLLKGLEYYKTKDLFLILALSMFRYLVFNIQFYLLLVLFEVPVTTFEIVLGITQFYFLMTLIPTFAISELGVRGSVSMVVFGLFTPITTGVLTASVVLWFINLALPALYGAFFLYRYKS